MVLVDDPVVRGSAMPTEGAATAAPALPRRTPRSHVHLEHAVVVAWALGTLACTIRLARAARKAAELRRAARAFSEAGDDVFTSDAIDAPLTAGIFRPAIVLPSAARDWSDVDVALAVAHERAHITRRDVLKQWIASAACTLYWFLPLAWLAARRMAKEREHAVDADVLRGGARPSAYASLLLRLASGSDDEIFAHVAANRSDLPRRVEAILCGHDHAGSRTFRFVGMSAVGLAALALACSGPGPSPKHATETAADRRSNTNDKQAAAEAVLADWLTGDRAVARALVVALEVPSGRVVALAGRDRAGATNPLERAYPPGSTIKPLVVAAALDRGAVRRDDIIDGEARTYESALGKTTITDDTPQRTMSLAKLLAVSSNVGATRVGDRLGARGLEEAFDAAGLFAPFGGGAAGARPTQDNAFQQAIVSLGHNMTINPIRLALAYVALAGSGEVPEPNARRRFVGPEAARAVREMLESVVEGEGTGVRAHVDGIRVAGKTGTADLDGVLGSGEDDMFYASFVGMFPADAPRYVVLVGAETKGGSGPHTAAPRFATLVRRAFR
jgi:beta-lactamase regulating signal transducer with metallopeptidase domain